MSRRELGSVYTPQAIARSMVSSCLDAWCGAQRSSANHDGVPSVRVLDPACGDGAFLLEVFDELCRRHGGQVSGSSVSGENGRPEVESAFRLAIVRDHIFGADIDPPAVETLRTRLLERIAASGEMAGAAVAVVERNIRCGNSLTGPDFGPPKKRCQEPYLPGLGPEPPEKVPDTFVIDWGRDFPDAGGAGGFDMIVGNPPYVRERNAKPLFDSLAATELGRAWREPRMDLWYYFVHRSLDLLRPGGTLSFIVNSYWMSSRGARRLIDRLQQETHLEEIRLLDAAPVFKAVAGRHMIFRLRKREAGGANSEMCRVVLAPVRTAPSVRQNDRPSQDPPGPHEYDVPLEELFQNGRLVVAPPDALQSVFRSRTCLGDVHETRQGIAENPPVINRRLLREFAGQYHLGEGVFVLKSEEIERLNLSADERALLRPYYVLAAVGRYRLAAAPTHQLLYLTHRTAPTLENLPQIAAHLARFRPILERRRETRAGRCAWWHLHWPRDEKIFVRPRILCVQMGERPQFVFAERPAFVGFSINLVLAGGEGFALEALTGVLNSDIARRWFERHAKRRGINLEINAHVLRQFPLPGRDEAIERKLGELVRARQNASSDEQFAPALEREIESQVERLYERKCD